MATTWAKPAGVPVFPPHADPDGASCAAAIAATWPDRATIAWPDGFALGIAHRLDTATSGALLLADDLDELARIRAAFASGAVRKVYRFETARTVPWTAHVVTAPIAHDKRHKGRVVVQRGAATPHRGRFLRAHTALRHLRGPLWEAVIVTGVMHQIRAHAAFVGLALTGDRRYGGGRAPDGFDAEFRLHHVGLRGPGGLRTEPVPLPAWARMPDEPGADRERPEP